MPQDLLTKWRVQNLRFSVFLANSADPEFINSWTQIVGHDADDTRMKGTGDQRVVRQQGPFGSTRISAEVRRNRIDWHVLPSPPKTPDERPVVGAYGELKDRFLNTMLEWVGRANPVASRLAYGAQLTLGTESRSEALEKLDELIATVDVDTQNTWDFDYTVNRRRESETIAGLMINRLVKWSVGQEIRGAVELPANGGQPRVNTTTAYLPVLTLDINTMPEFPGPIARLGELLTELAGLGTEIASQGDVP